MTTTHRSRPRRRLDISGLALTAVGLVFGLFSYLLATYAGISPLVMIPSVVAATIGATHLVKYEAPRE